MKELTFFARGANPKTDARSPGAKVDAVTNYELKAARMPQNLDELFLAVKMHGRLNLFNHAQGDTWSAWCELPVVNAPGATFKIESGFGHRTPHEALQAILSRIAQGQGR